MQRSVTMPARKAQAQVQVPHRQLPGATALFHGSFQALLSCIAAGDGRPARHATVSTAVQTTGSIKLHLPYAQSSNWPHFATGEAGRAAAGSAISWEA